MQMEAEMVVLENICCPPTLCISTKGGLKATSILTNHPFNLFVLKYTLLLRPNGFTLILIARNGTCLVFLWSLRKNPTRPWCFDEHFHLTHPATSCDKRLVGIGTVIVSVSSPRKYFFPSRFVKTKITNIKYS